MLDNPSSQQSAASPDYPSGARTEITRLRLKVLALAAENQRLQETVSYQLGSAITRAKTMRGLLGLPAEIIRVLGVSHERRGMAANAAEERQRLETRLRTLLDEIYDQPAEAIVASVCADTPMPAKRALLLTELSTIIRAENPEKAADVLRGALAQQTSLYRRRLLATMLADIGAIEEPDRMFKALRRTPEDLTNSELSKAKIVEGMARISRSGLAIPEKSPPPAWLASAEPRSILYVAASSLAYHTTGYTARTHALVRAIADAGWTVHVATRPGYPIDRNDVHQTPSSPTATIDGVAYVRLAGPKANATPFDEYCDVASRSILKHIQKVRPRLVQAASNHLNAAPALIAARQAGLPFVYEVRGLWELTRAAKDPTFEHSEKFAWQKAQEATVAREADLVLTISEGLKRELVKRGVDAERIVVAPNCVDADRFRPETKDAALAGELALNNSTVLGFIGSMTSYEGLTDVLEAIARLRAEGRDVRALLVGDGPAAREIREAARDLNLWRQVIMPGRVPHDDVSRWYSVMDVAVYPRHPSQVTELVPPLKPLEAMAMGLPVVASDVAAIRESITDGDNGFLFKSADVTSLVETLRRVLDDHDLRQAVARRGREVVESRFTWKGTAQMLDEVYRSRLI